MIAPRPGLIGWGAAIVLPLTILSTLLPGWRTLTLPALALFVVIALLDLLWNWRKHRDLEFVFSDTVRTIAGRSFQIPLRLFATPAQSGAIRVALTLPSSFSMATVDALLTLKSGESPLPILLELRAESRGVFLISQLFFDWISPLGWWIYRERQPIRCEVRVYPDLTTEGRQLARFLKRNEVGIHHYRHLGRGREFEKLREYGEQIPTLEREIASSLLFCAAAQNQGDLFGLLTFSDKIDHLVTARSGPAHFNRCRDVLVGLQTRLVSPDFGEIASTLMARIKRRALIVFLTSLDDPLLSETFLSSMDFVARRHLVLAVMLLAPSVRPLFSPPGVEKIDDIYQNIAGHLHWTRLIELRRQLQQRGIQLCLVSNKSVSLEMVSQYIALTRRQAL